MSRARRQIISGKVYELVFRLKQGLPFVCADYMSTILLGILARVQRDSKISLCHYLFMANHVHFIVVAKDKQDVIDFMQEFKKKCTEALKRLHGKKHLLAWEINSAPILLPTQADVEDRIRYIYCNPAKAHLIDSIKEYPGASSWQVFNDCLPSIDGSVSTVHPWIQAPNIPLITRGINPYSDKLLTRQLKETANESHEIIVEPYAWARSFKLSEAELKSAFLRIKESISRSEEALRVVRREEKRGVFGSSRLQNEVPKIDGYVPSKKERKIFVICHDSSLRSYLIANFKAFCKKCKACYREMLLGNSSVQWPPAAFIPPMRSLSNALVW